MKSLKRILPLAGAAIVAAGCGSDGTTAPLEVSGPPIDVPSLVARMSTGGLGAAVDLATVPLGNVIVPAIPASATSSCPYSTSTQMFACPAYSGNGLTYTVSYALIDAAGHAISKATSTGIASIRTVVDFSGAYSPPTSPTGPSGTQRGHSELTATGLLTDHRTYNGTMTIHIDQASSGDQISSDETMLTSSVVVPVATSSAQSVWPTGTVTTTIITAITFAPTIISHFNSGFIFTFDGTNRVKIVDTRDGQPLGSCIADMTNLRLGCLL